MSSKSLLDKINEKNWEINPSGIHVIDAVPAFSIKASKEVNRVKELVYTGTFTVIDGIKLFCDSIAKIAAELGEAKIAVTFLGVSGRIEGLASEEWIEIQGSAWDEHNIKWNIVTVDNTEGILDYLSKDPGRLAVLPSLFDPSAFVAKGLFVAGFPMLLSSQSAIKDTIKETLWTVNPDIDSLTSELKKIFNEQHKCEY